MSRVQVEYFQIIVSPFNDWKEKVDVEHNDNNYYITNCFTLMHPWV